MPRATVVLFDVNETPSDLEPLRGRLEQVGAPAQLLDTWFASTLRDGSALAAARAYADFRPVAVGVLRGLLAGIGTLRGDPGEAAEQVVSGLAELDLHPDVPEGITNLADRGVRMATLTNGAAEVAEQLLKRGGLDDLVERSLSVDRADLQAGWLNRRGRGYPGFFRPPDTAAGTPPAPARAR